MHLALPAPAHMQLAPPVPDHMHLDPPAPAHLFKNGEMLGQTFRRPEAPTAVARLVHEVEVQLLPRT